MGGQLDGQQFNDLRSQAWDRAIHAAGTGHIFSTRAQSLRRKMTWLTWTGFAVPVAVAAVVTGYGLDAPFLPIVLWVAAGLGGLQLLASLWSLAADWPGNLERAVRSSVANEDLAQRAESLGKTPPASEAALRHALDVLSAADGSQRQQDQALGVSDKDKRRGMRYALFRYRRSCVHCGRIPKNLKPTDCGVCGDF